MTVKVVEKGTGETVPFSMIFCKNSNTFLGETNDEGYAFVRLNDCDTLFVSNLSYRDTSIFIPKGLDYILVSLNRENILETVEVYSNRPNQIREEVYALEKLKNFPVILGERDLIKALTLTPGVQTTIEGASAISVRGGSADQNLLLMDGAKIYNSGHLFGFLSVVNDKIIKDLKFYKSYMPANYSSRLSSIIDLEIIDGNKKKHEKSLTLGLLNSNFSVNGPLVKDKVSYVFGARLAYTGIVLTPVQLSKSANKVNYNVIDLNSKISYDINDHEKLNFSFNFNKDLFQSKTIEVDQTLKVKMTWGNITGGLEYFNLIRNNYVFKVRANFSNYLNNLSLEADQSTSVSFVNRSKILDYSLQSEFAGKFLKYFDFRLGVSSNLLKIAPVDRFITIGEVVNQSTGYAPRISNHSAFGELFHNNRFFDFRLGLRYDAFENLNEKYKSNYLQPRPQLTFHLTKNLYLETAYTNNVQNVHSISTTAGSFFIDVWVPSTQLAIPSRSEMINLGVFYKRNKFKLGIEAYEKHFSDLTELDPQKSFFLTTSIDWQADLLTGGIGKARGIELYTELQGPKSSLTFNYNLSRSSRQFAQINNEEWYDFRYDRRHLLNAIYSGEINKKLKFNSAFIFSTGHPLTLPSGVIQDINGNYDIYYDKLYNSRFPNYHRLDLSLNYTKTSVKGNEIVWNFSLYNAYAQRNIFGVQISNPGKFDSLNNVKVATKSYFRLIPGISYTINFK